MYSLRQVYRNPSYVLLSAVVFLLTIGFILLAPNWGLIAQVVQVSGLMAGTKLALSLLLSIQTNMTSLDATFAFAVSLLFGINVSLLVYRIQISKKVNQGSATTSGVGLFAGLLGIGCASCGTVLVSAFVPLVGAGGALTFLPLGGQELLVVAVLLLGFSIWKLSKDIATPATCAVPDLTKN